MPPAASACVLAGALETAETAFDVFLLERRPRISAGACVSASLRRVNPPLGGERFLAAFLETLLLSGHGNLG